MAQGRNQSNDSVSNRYEAIVIGSGFAGAVTACRLAEAGINVCVLERGRRFDPKADFPVYPKPDNPHVPSDAPTDGRSTVQPDASRFFWALGRGVWDFRDLGDVLLGQAAGYGGGSLIYANVHLRPPEHVFDERWPIRRAELEGYYDLAALNLGVVTPPAECADLPKRVQLEHAATELEKQHVGSAVTRKRDDSGYLRPLVPPLAVNFPAGPPPTSVEIRRHGRLLGKPHEGQSSCDLAGNCCLGCPHGAKNTLDFNYLARAEAAGAAVRTLVEVVGIHRSADRKTTTLACRDHLSNGASLELEADNVFLCAGAVNTTELILRSSFAEDLKKHGLGTHFHPNQDSLSAIFECDEPQELDRGPTITSTLVYDREPPEDDPATHWRMRFTGGRFAPSPGDEISCGTKGRARVAAPAYVFAGSFAEENATGELTLTRWPGDSSLPKGFTKGETLLIDKRDWAQADGEPSPPRHWFLIQDGGLPTPFEPTLGVFRSPLWLGRNGFREKRGQSGAKVSAYSGGGDHHESDHRAAATKRIGYAALPIEALTDLFAGLTRRSAGAWVNELSERALQLLRESDFEPRESLEHDDESSDTGDDRPWSLLPDQLASALRELKGQTLDRLGLESESIVASFVNQAADRLSDQLDPALAKFGKSDQEYISDLHLAARGLRLGVQLLWGSQAGMARAIGEEVLSRLLPGGGELMEAGVELLKWVLDYRLGDGRTAMLLSMGLDSAPGTLELELPVVPELGGEIRGATSGTRAFLLAVCPTEKNANVESGEPATLVVTRATGELTPGEALWIGSRSLGVFRHSRALSISASDAQQDGEESQFDLGLLELHYTPSPDVHSISAPLRANLPPACDTPERAIQERALRDIASVWGGELRTDPQWTFLKRRVTVHPQGGCPMGPTGETLESQEGVTDKGGELRGWPGLYVMDAAAFPGPVGSNPSATIAALAEYKVEKFLRAFHEDLKGSGASGRAATVGAALSSLAEERERAGDWVDERGREALDPLGPTASKSPRGDSVEPAHRPVGIEFDEKMVGRLGLPRVCEVELELKVRIEDLADYLERHARDSEVRVPIVDGSIKVVDRSKKRTRKLVRGNGSAAEPSPPPDIAKVDAKDSYMIIMADRGPDLSGREVRQIRYYVVAKGSQNAKYILRGSKNIQDDPGFDAWEDTTTLNFELEIAGETQGKGKLRLPAAEFFGSQLRSFRADTDDPIRQVWALASFGTFFFGNLAEVYFPGVGKLTKLGASAMGRGHD